MLQRRCEYNLQDTTVPIYKILVVSQFTNGPFQRYPQRPEKVVELIKLILTHSSNLKGENSY